MEASTPNLLQPTGGTFIETGEHETGFAAYFDANIRPLLDSMEAKRLEALAEYNRRKPWGYLIGGAVVVAFLALMGYVDESAIGSRFWLFPAIICIFILAWVQTPARGYEKSEKESILPTALRFYGDISFTPAGGITQMEIANSFIMPSGRTEIMDTASGDFHGRRMSVSRVRITQRQGKHTVTVFNGNFIAADLARNTHAATIVRETSSEQVSWNGRPLEHVSLESTHFENRFEVYGSDQVMARVFLAPDVMERLLALDALPGMYGIRCSLIGSRLSIALPTGKEMFVSDGIKVSAYDTQDLHTMLKEIGLLLTLMDALELKLKA